MKATCTSWSWSLLRFDEVVRIMSLLGFRAIDVGAFSNWAHFEPDELAAHATESARELVEIALRYDVALTDLFVTFGPGLTERCVNFPDASVRAANLETFKRLAEFCRQAGIPGITLCPGVCHDELGRDASMEIAVEEFSRLVDAGYNAGLRVSFEPHVESIAESPGDVLHIVKHVPKLKLTLDYSHFIYQGYGDADLEPLLPHTGHFHVRQARKGVLQCRVSEGAIDFGRALKALSTSGYDGWVAFEYVWEQWKDNDRVDVLSETLMLRQQLRSFFEETEYSTTRDLSCQEN